MPRTSCLAASRFLLVTAALPATFALFGASANIDFGRDIQPILSENCLKCHGFDVEQRKGGLRLDTPEAFQIPLDSGTVPVRPGDLERSELWRRVSHPSNAERMPPSSSGKTLTPEEKERIRQWILEGASVDQHWAFLAPRRPVLPAVAHPHGITHPIDAFVMAKLDALGLPPSPEATAQTLIRRLSFDLRGLPPTPEEVDRFLEDERPDAYQRLVDRWMASPRYGERMAQDWLDAARYADTAGHAADVPRSMWLYRDWVIDALNRNQPFDQFTIEQLAGDLIPDATLSQQIATGFHRNSMQALGNNPRKEEFRVKGIVDRLETTGRVWMGVTVACAECHDHKYDPITTKDYYRLFAIFNNVPHYGERFEIHGPRLEVLLGDGQPQWDAAARLIENTQSQLARIDSGQQGERQRQWESDPVGYLEQEVPWPFENPVSLSTARLVEETPWNRGTSFALDQESPPLLGPEAFRLDGPLTLSMWVRTRSAIADLVSNYDWKAGKRSLVLGIGGQGLNGETPPGHLYAWISSEAKTFKGIEVTGSQAINDGEWHHLALTYRPGKGVDLFVDGEMDPDAKRKGRTPDAVAKAGRPLVIGAGYDNTEHPNAFRLEGLLHDVRVYRRIIRDPALLGASSITIRSALALPPSERSSTQREALQTYFGRIDPVSRTLRQRILEQKEIQAALESRAVTAQVMDELGAPRKTFVHIRGNFENRGEEVTPGTPRFLPPLPDHQPANRLTFAQWLVAPENPLTARVTVNRVWAHYFGKGLVTTIDDFGIRSAPPSHPQLLDWLAVELMESGWDMKALHRQIITSATYRQSSKRRPESLGRDPDNRWLARGPRFRLPAEQVRDNALCLSGLLTDRVGGPSVYPIQPDGVGEYRDATAGKWETSRGEDGFRRSLYTFWQRTSPYPSLILFDAPSRERSCVHRSTTNTPLQALALLNDPVYVEMAKALAQRIIDHAPDWDARIDFAFQTVLSRRPHPTERRRFLHFQPQASASPNGASPSNKTLSTWTLLAQVLLNLDETITKE